MREGFGARESLTGLSPRAELRQIRQSVDVSSQLALRLVRIGATAPRGTLDDLLCMRPAV